ncbi:fibroblast growth factor-binding protein 3 [Dromaius novaehollandiae]|uniref:fibroblast growth factor-binding protein 3 n=1 Tax=Dromaius novaehollandiae TaxID=8790 RepID=UPI00311EE432
MRLPLALLVLAALGAAAGGPDEAAQAGQFSTPEQHRCSWQLRSAAGASELRLSCRPPAGRGAARRCVYRGEPRRCAAYGARSRQYWRQILGKLRRRRHPCAADGPLSARLCGQGRAPPEAQLRLLPAPSATPPGPGAAGGTAEPPEDLAETYCAERWHSLCSFLVGFWQG